MRKLLHCIASNPLYEPSRSDTADERRLKKFSFLSSYCETGIGVFMSRRKSAAQSKFALSMYLEAMHSKSLSQTSTAPSDFIANFLTPGTHKRKTLNDLPTVVDESFCSLGSEERSKPHNYSRPPPFPRHNEETGRRA